jgi:hypothetical protein
MSDMAKLRTLAALLLGTANLAACEGPTESWQSGVRAKLAAAEYQVGDTVTVWLVNNAGETRHMPACWDVSARISGAWQRRGGVCDPVIDYYAIAAGDSLEQRIPLWSVRPEDMVIGAPALGAGAFRLAFVVQRYPHFEARGDGVSTPSFVVDANVP